MTIQSIGLGFLFPEQNRVTSATFSFSSYLLDAADEKMAAVFMVPRTGNIRAIRWTTGTVTTGGTVDVRLETVDPALGMPTGTLVATNSRQDQVVLTTDDNIAFRTQLIADSAVTRGTVIAVVIANPSASFGNIGIRHMSTSGAWAVNFPFVATYTASWAGQSLMPNVGIEYSDGTYAYVDGLWYFSDSTVDTWNNAGSPIERGLKFKLPFPARVSGFGCYLDSEDFDAKLYDSDGTTVLATKTIESGWRAGPNDGVHRFIFDSDVNLVKDVWYRLVIRPTTASSVDLSRFNVPSAAVMDCNPGGQNLHWTQGSSGSWTDDTTKRPLLSLNISGFDDGTGGGVTNNYYVVQTDSPVVFVEPSVKGYRP